MISIDELIKLADKIQSMAEETKEEEPIFQDSDYARGSASGVYHGKKRGLYMASTELWKFINEQSLKQIN